MQIEDFLEMNHISVRPDPSLPVTVRACCYHDNDGNEYVLYNPVFSREDALFALEHELEHIANGDMYDGAYREYDERTEQDAGFVPDEQDLEFVRRLAHAYTMAVADANRMCKLFAPRPIARRRKKSDEFGLV